MNVAEVGGPKLKCAACHKLRNLRAELTSFELNSTLGIFMCRTKGCMYPLNSKNMHKFVFKLGPDGDYCPYDPSEVPNLKDLHSLLLASRNQGKDPPSSPNSSAPPCDIKQVTDAVPDKEEKVDTELYNPQPENVELIPKEACDESVSYGAKFVTSNNVFPIWENKDALCWLDSTLCLLVHSKNLKTYFKSETFGECQLKDISIAYDEAVSVLNSEKRSTRATRLPDVPFADLEKVRERTFEFLQPFQRCKKGQEDSPVFALMVLLKQNRYLNNLFLLHFLLELKCSSCGYMKSSQNRKTLVTIPGVLEDFSENQLVYLRPCFQCQKIDQKITLKFLKLPPLLLMHFVEGLPHSNISSYDMVFSQRGYCVRGFVQYIEPERHFITWVRDDTGDQWLCCDDLNPPLQRFKAKLPDIAASEIHIVMWEQKETSDEDNFHLHYSGDENYNDSLSSMESASPPLIVLDDSDSEAEAKSRMSHKPLSTVNDPPSKNDFKTSGEGIVSTCAGQQHEQMLKDNISSSSSSKPPSDSRQDACGDLVTYSSSGGRARERHTEQQDARIQSISSMTQKCSPVKKDILDPDLMPTQKSSNKDYIHNDKEHSKSGVISNSISDQDGKETNDSCLSHTKEQVMQFSTDSRDCARSIHNNMSENDDNKSTEFNECGTVIRAQVVHQDIRDEKFPYHCEGNESHLNTETGSGTTSVGNYDICEKNLGSKLYVGVCSSLPEKKNNLSPTGQNKVYTENPSWLDGDYAATLCRNIKPCFVVLNRSETDLYAKKMSEQKTRPSTRSHRKVKCAQMTMSDVDSCAVAPVVCRKWGAKRKAASFIKQSSFDAGLQDTDVKLQVAHVSGSSSSDQIASVSVVPNKRFVKEQKTEKMLKNSVQRSPVPGHVSEQSSDLTVHKTESTIFSSQFSVKGEQQNYGGTSPKMDASNTKSSEAKQDVILQNDNSDSGGTSCLSSGFLSLSQSLMDVLEGNLRTPSKAVKKDITNENSHSLNDQLDEKNSAPSKVSVTSDPVKELKLRKDKSLRTQTSSYPDSPLAHHSVSQTDYATSSKIIDTCGSSGYKLENGKSSLSAGLSGSKNSNIVSSGEVSSLVCDEGCTCDLCSVQKFIQNYESNKLKPQDMPHNAVVLGETTEIPDDHVNMGSSDTSTTVVEQAEQCLDSTLIMHNKSHVPPKKANSAKVCALDNSLVEKNSCHRTLHRKMSSRKCPVSKIRNTMGTKDICKNTMNGLEISQELRVCINNLHDKDLKVSQVSEACDSDLASKKFEMAPVFELPYVQHSCMNTQSGCSEQQVTVSPVRKHKAGVKTSSASVGSPHLFESSIQENLNEPMEMVSLPVEQEETCKSADKRICERPDTCKNSPVSEWVKRQQHSEESFGIDVPKKQHKDKCDKSKSIGQKSLLSSDVSACDSVLPRHKMERKFEPDSVKFVEVPVHSQSSDTEDEERYGEMTQSVTVELCNLSTHKKTSSQCSTKGKKSARYVVKYKDITAIFETSFEDDLMEFPRIPARAKLPSFNEMTSPHPSQSDTTNINVSSCEHEKQGITGISDMHLQGNASDTETPAFNSVDLLRAHLCSEPGPQTNVLHSSAKSNRGRKKLQVVPKDVKRGRKKCNDIQVQDSEKLFSSQKTLTQRSPKQHRKCGSKELHCDVNGILVQDSEKSFAPQKTQVQRTLKEHRKCGSKELLCDAPVVGQIETSEEINSKSNQEGDKYPEGNPKKDRNYFATVKKQIRVYSLTFEHRENEDELSAPTKSPSETKEITTDISTKTEDLSPPCQIQANSDATRGILTEKKERKKPKTVRFSIEPKEESNSVPERQTVNESVRSSAESQEVSVKKRRNVVEIASRKKVKSETPVSPVQNVDSNESDNHGDQSELDDTKPAIPELKPKNLSLEPCIVNPFLFCPKDLTLNCPFKVAVPRPQVRKTRPKAF